MPLKRRFPQSKDGIKSMRTMMKSRPNQIPRPRLRTARNVEITVSRRCYVGNPTFNTTTTAGFYSYVSTSLSTAGTIGGTALTGLSNVSEYAAVFDQYRINSITYEFVPRTGPYMQQQTVPSTGTSFADKNYITILIDPYGRTNPTGTYTVSTYNAFQESGKPKMYDAGKKITVTIRNPKVVDLTGNASAPRYLRPQWFDLSSSGNNVPHQGMYIFAHCGQFTAANFPQVDVFVTYNISFRGMS